MTEKKRNRLKNIPKEAGSEVNPGKEKESKPSVLNRFRSLFTFSKDERLQKLTGLSLMLFAFYFLIAFVSFLFTWKSDQDKVLGSWSDLLFADVKVDNWLGKAGALLSHQFIHKWFGISSFVFALLCFTAGTRLLLKTSLLPLGKTFKYSLFALLWVSVTFGYLFNTSYFYLGGGFGYTISDQLNLLLGNIGTGFFLLFSLLAFLIISFNIDFKRSKAEVPVPDAADPELPVNMYKNEAIPEDIPDQIIEKQSAEIALAVTDDIVVEPKAAAEEIKKPEKEEIILSNEGVQFSIEKTENEEILTESVVDDGLLFGEYDPTLELSSYQVPPIDLLEQYNSGKEINVNTEELNANKNRIVETLGNYNIQIEKIKATIGPTVTLYEIIPAAGVRISKIKNLEDDIALSLSALGIRIIAPIPGKGTIGIEVPNQNPETVPMRSIIASEKFQTTGMELPVALGKTISNETYIADLAKMPHLLMAGATGQGKSVGLNAILVSLLYKKHPSQIKFVLVDPKKVELTLFNKIERHFLAKLPDTEEAIITDTKKVIHTLNSLCIEMDQRYDLLKEAQVRNIKEYNTKFVARKLNPNKGHKFLPYIILVVDEFADLIMTAGKEVETPIARLAQLARAIGIHLIIATQRPSVNIITGTIKANFPARIAFRVTSKIDSRTILDSGGADQLIGRGDMLLSTGNDLIRLQCAFVDTPEVDRITNFIGSQKAYPEAFQLPEYSDETELERGELDAADKDALFEEAARMIVQHQQGSASLLQRRLKLGYNRAGRIIDQLEAAGIIGPFEGSKAREVLIKDPISLEQFLNSMSNSNNKPHE